MRRLPSRLRLLPIVFAIVGFSAIQTSTFGQAASSADKKEAAKKDADKTDKSDAVKKAAPLTAGKSSAKADDPFADEPAATDKSPAKTSAKGDEPLSTTPAKGKADEKANPKPPTDPFGESTTPEGKAPAKALDKTPKSEPGLLPGTEPAKTPKGPVNPFEDTGDAKPGDAKSGDAKSTDTKPLTDTKPSEKSSRPLTDTLSDTKTTEAPPSPGQAELNRGQELLDAGKYAEAIEPLKKSIKLLPSTEAGPHYTLGVVYRMLNRYDDAIEEFSEALKIDPALTSAALRRGVCWYYKDEYALAQADFEDASVGGSASGDTSASNFNSACPLTWKGMTLVKLGQLRDAVNVYSEALRSDNRYAPAHINRGLAYIALREYAKAVADFDLAIRSTPKDASLYFKRGVAQGGLGDWRGAVKSYTEALRINPKYAEAYSNRSAAYRRLGDEAKAQADAAKSGELKSTTARAAQSAAR
jgi:tetratricopeptide (TPR) repeat protein